MKNFLIGVVFGIVLTSIGLSVSLVISGQCLRVFPSHDQARSNIMMGKCPTH